MSIRIFRNSILGSAALTAGLLALGVPARAQSPGSSAPSDRPAYWETIGGYEGDTHSTGYGFFGPAYNKPLNDHLAVTAHVFGNYLHYSFANGLGGTTEVRAPGFSPAVGLRFGRKTTFTVTAGLSAKHRSEQVTDFRNTMASDTDKWQMGASFGSQLYWNLSGRDNIHALADYSTVDKYLWSRVGYKRQVSNVDWRGHTTVYLGAEGITQGNQDIRSNQVGALAELLLVPSQLSLMARGGYKVSSFKIGPDKKGPYFGIGLYKRF